MYERAFKLINKNFSSLFYIMIENNNGRAASMNRTIVRESPKGGKRLPTREFLHFYSLAANRCQMSFYNTAEMKKTSDVIRRNGEEINFG